MRKHIGRRLRYLWTFELANALLVFPLCYTVIGWRYRLGWFSLASLLVVCAILVVGAVFWFLKGRALHGSGVLSQPGTRAFFRGSKVAFGIMLPALLGLFAVRALVQRDASRAELVAGGALLLMALLEYINYYFIQLSYDNRADLQHLLRHRRLKRAVMVRELGI